VLFARREVKVLLHKRFHLQKSTFAQTWKTAAAAPQ
jgi:hypothetical protein